MANTTDSKPYRISQVSPRQWAYSFTDRAASGVGYRTREAAEAASQKKMETVPMGRSGGSPGGLLAHVMASLNAS